MNREWLHDKERIIKGVILNLNLDIYSLSINLLYKEEGEIRILRVRRVVNRGEKNDTIKLQHSSRLSFAASKY